MKVYDWTIIRPVQEMNIQIRFQHTLLVLESLRNDKEKHKLPFTLETRLCFGLVFWYEVEKPCFDPTVYYVSSTAVPCQYYYATW